MPAVLLCLILALLSGWGPAAAGEAEGPIPAAELSALDRAIELEFNTSRHGSQTLADLQRLKFRLMRMQTATPAATDARSPALLPIHPDDSQARILERLLADAATGDRPAQRSLALYYLYLNEPEKALAEWRRMGRASEADLPYLLISAYLELALGEYAAVRERLAVAERLMDSRASLAVSHPGFCLNVAGYRVFTPRGSEDFLPGEDTLIYVEVDGADFHETADGGRECRLMFGLKLQNENRQTLWAEPNYGEYAPFFSGPVRDLHAALSWRVPNELRQGRYHLRIEAVDQESRRRGEAVLGFNVGKRDTNPEPAVAVPSAAPSPARIDRAQQEANQTFYGGFRAESGKDSSRLRSDFEKNMEFELIRQNERMQRVE